MYDAFVGKRDKVDEWRKKTNGSAGMESMSLVVGSQYVERDGKDAIHL